MCLRWVVFVSVPSGRSYSEVFCVVLVVSLSAYGPELQVLRLVSGLLLAFGPKRSFEGCVVLSRCFRAGVISVRRWLVPATTGVA